MDNKLLLEGGVGGHMNHPYDNDELTFGQLKDLLRSAVAGELRGTEKTDGQNIMISWRNGRLIAARNKGHLRDRGASALTTAGISKMFAGRGDLHKAFAGAMVDLEDAISALSDKQKEKIFKEVQNKNPLHYTYPLCCS